MGWGQLEQFCVRTNVPAAFILGKQVAAGPMCWDIDDACGIAIRNGAVVSVGAIIGGGVASGAGGGEADGLVAVTDAGVVCGCCLVAQVDVDWHPEIFAMD